MPVLNRSREGRAASAWRVLGGRAGGWKVKGACWWRSFLSGSSHAYALRSFGTAGSFKSQGQPQGRFIGLKVSFFFLRSFVVCYTETCHSKRSKGILSFASLCLCVCHEVKVTNTDGFTLLSWESEVFCKSCSTFFYIGGSLSWFISGKRPKHRHFRFLNARIPHKKTSEHNILTLTVSVECRLSLCVWGSPPLAVYLPTSRLIINAALKSPSSGQTDANQTWLHL